MRDDAELFEGEDVTFEYVMNFYNTDDVSHLLTEMTSWDVRISNRKIFHQVNGLSRKNAAITANEIMRADNGGLQVPEIDLRRRRKGKYNPSIKPL